MKKIKGSKNYTFLQKLVNDLPDSLSWYFFRYGIALVGIEQF